MPSGVADVCVINLTACRW